MADAAHGLKLKYGLRQQPTPQQVSQWAQLTRTVAATGYSLEASANAAARTVFADFNTVVYASEADTIEALLRAAEGRN